LQQATQMHRIAVGIEYDGSAFAGWQSQQALRTVQQTLEGALGAVAAEPVSLVAAGRTDAGVHARAQVAHFDSEAERTPRSWLLGANSELPADVALRWAQPVPAHFHARYSAEARIYRYLILNRTARSALNAARTAWVTRTLDAVAMTEAAAQLVGEHDFSAFRAAECQAKSPIRRLTGLEVARRGDWIVIEAVANAFLHHMVRNIVGLLLAIGQQRAAPERAREQLASRARSSGEATAAAHGLYLWQVDYGAQFGLPTDSAMIEAPIPGWP
jgi:tRNA pseudouridine38-40 synthase